jgi:polar amino acid transport system substrate-binding protein
VRKLPCLLATVLAGLMLAACGGDNGGGSTSSAATTGSGDDRELGADRELTIDHPKGFEVDFGAAIAQQLKIPKVKWINTPFSGLFSPAPKNFDLAINEITATPQRAKVVDFSDSYFDANQGFLVKKGGPGEQARSIADMKGLQFGYQATTTGGDYIKDKIKPSKQPREFSTLGAATKALANGQIDAFVMDVAIGSGIVKKLPDDVAMTGQFKTGEKYAVLLQKGNPLKARVNQAIAALKSGGKLQELQKKWFPGTESLPTFS